MPISEDEWNKGKVDFFPRLRPVVMEILNATTNAYTTEEILYFLGRPDNDLPDELMDDLRILANDAQWAEQGERRQMPILTSLLEKLVADGEVEFKEINQGAGPLVTYYKAKSTK